MLIMYSVRWMRLKLTRPAWNNTPDTLMTPFTSFIMLSSRFPSCPGAFWSSKPICFACIIILSAPTFSNCALMVCWSPWPREIKATTAAMPMKTPSIVRDARFLRFMMFLSAMRSGSIRSPVLIAF